MAIFQLLLYFKECRPILWYCWVRIGTKRPHFLTWSSSDLSPLPGDQALVPYGPSGLVTRQGTLVWADQVKKFGFGSLIKYVGFRLGLCMVGSVLWMEVWFSTYRWSLETGTSKQQQWNCSTPGLERRIVINRSDVSTIELCQILACSLSHSVFTYGTSKNFLIGRNFHYERLIIMKMCNIT